jgi:anaerobic selenocysteine-containing dehydrogenase
VSEDKVTFCRICEPFCGLVATVEDGRIVGVRGDRDNPFSQGFCCAKGVAMADVVTDPDRVIEPLRRCGGPGEFVPVPWDEALDDVARRLRAIVDEQGGHAFGGFIGNPPYFSYSAPMFFQGFLDAVGTKWKYGVNAEDAASRIAANAILYGSAALLLKPDLWRTDFAILIGANPLVSHGSVVSEPRIREALDAIAARGGRVVVIDPRRTETARRYEHVPVRGGTDAWLLAALCNVIIEHGLADRAFVDAHTTGYDAFAAALARFTPEHCAPRCRVPATTITALAREFAAAPNGVVYGRTGTCTQRFGTLNNLLQDAINILTGRIERRGGWVVGWGPIDFEAYAEKSGLSTYGAVRSRVTGLPDVNGQLASSALAADITTPGEGQVRALLTMGANPVISSGGGGRDLEDALEQLELHFSLDLYVNETNKHAQYIFPVTTFFEREDVPLLVMGNMLRPAVMATEAVVAPPPGVRQEWEILNELARRMGLGGAYSAPALRRLAKLGLRVKPRPMIDAMLRLSDAGDRFGLRRNGISFKKLLTRHPHGVVLQEELPIRPLETRLRTADRRIPLGAAPLLEQLRRLADFEERGDFPLRVIGMRELRSQNTWMHNVARLMPDGRVQRALVHPDDATAAGLEDGRLATISSETGTVTVAIEVTTDMTPGTIAVPHGWGHNGGWRRANGAGGANSNELALARPADVEALAGMSILNGIPVRLARTPLTPEARERDTVSI